jgi:type IV secretory pathway TraG/TraD family ATPase VirD4
MSRGAPATRRPPYWTLPAFALLASLPMQWAIVAGAAAMIVGAALALARARGRRRLERAQREALGPAVVLGTDERGRQVLLADRQLESHGLIVGASGAGKSTTLLGIVTDRIRRGLPVVVIDLKGSPAFAAELGRGAARAGRPFRLWTPDGPSRWNPLAHGNATELKDKLIATERFSEPHYQRAAERYVQTALQVLEAYERRPQLAEVVALMEPGRLAGAARSLRSPLRDRVQDYLAGLTPDQLSAVRGLGTRLAILSESHAGRWLADAPQRDAGDGDAQGEHPAGPSQIDLRSALDGPEVVLFSLNSSVYGQLAAQLGTLAIQDLVSATGRRLERRVAPTQATVAIDEFSALGTDHVLALVARGREAGVSVLLATQELADLERAARGFRDQVMGLTGVKIAHRQDAPASAQMIAQMVGTEWTWEMTHQIRSPFGPAGASRGTRREVERFIVHPDEIKTLPRGHAVLLTKTPAARVTRVRVSPPAHSRATSHGGLGADDRSGFGVAR